MAALGRHAMVECGTARVFGFDKLGKKMETDKLIIEMPKEVNWKRKKETAKEIANEKCPDGWESDNYFGSQDSFFRKDGKDYARVTIRRWV